MSHRAARRRLWLWICLPLLLLASCAGVVEVPVTQQASPTAVITTLETFESALAGAAFSFEIIGPVDPSPAWQGRQYLINGEAVTALQAEAELEQAQVSAAFDSFASGLPSPPQQWRSERLAIFYAGSQGGITLLISGLLGDPQRLQSARQDEPYPPAVSAAIQRVSEQYEVAPSQLQVSSIERVTWPSSCLGLAEPGEACTEAVVDGWSIELEGAGDTWQAHTDELGNRVRLDALEGD